MGPDTIPFPGVRTRDATRPRPAVFRALGRDDPPATIELDGETFRLLEILKHDSWAATATYRSATRTAKCKFNRTQPVLLVPLGWLGRLLAAREAWFMDRLHGIPGIPEPLGGVRVGGRSVPHAVAHVWIEGRALAEGEWVDDRFFPALAAILRAVHHRGVAHVDLHKRENLLVDTAGRPHLIDYQISFGVAPGGVAARVFGGLLRMLQRCDEYHLLKHRLKHRPDQVRLSLHDLERMRPWWIRLHRCVAVPFRTTRRRLLTALRIRSATGHAFTEAFPEIAHRRAA
ncbi:MAG: hypothetical protein EBZ74_11575 [Planctomycetia bacterium]|nr:hypothetical protein [Planctomycetia bacterium]